MKKRILSLLLAVVMIMSFIPPMHVHAAECSHYVLTWSATSDGTNRHYGRCFNCNENVYSDCDTNAYVFDYSDHYAACSVCKRKASATATPHTLAYEKWDAFYHQEYCTDCGYKGSLYSHSKTWEKDATQHWEECSECDFKSTKSNHGSYTTTSNGDGTHAQKCGTCDYSKSAETCTYAYSFYGGSDKTAEGHTLICTKCGHESAIQPHTPKYTQSNSMSGTTHTSSCTVCSYTLVSGEKCTSNTWLESDGKHYKVCDTCKLEFARGAHTGEVVSNNNGTHKVACKECGKGGNENCTDFEWEKTSSGHTKKCTECGYAQSSENHTWKYDSTGSYYHKKYCSVCGYVADSSARHDFGEYKYLNGQHWQECKDCHATTTKTNCSSRQGAKSDNNGNHSFTCDTCKNVVTKQCDENSWDQTSTTHAKKCSVCGYTKTATNHQWTYDKLTHSNGQHEKTCNICSYSEYEDCGKKYTDNNDGKTHTVTCEKCGRININENHSFNSENECACGAIKHVHKWELSASGNKITLTCKETKGTCNNKKSELVLNAPANLTYDGSAKKATVAAPDFMGDVGYIDSVYYREAGSSYGGSTSVPTDAGTYIAKVTYYLNSESATATVEFTITKKDVTVTAEGYTGVYDGNPHGITVIVPEGLTVEYSTDGSSYSSFAPTFTNAGTYDVYYRVTGDGNYNIVGATGKKTVTITPKPLTVEAQDKTVSYNGQEHNITVTGLEGTNLKAYFGDSESDCDDLNFGKTDAGEYEIFYRIGTGIMSNEDIDNYDITYQNKKAKLTINPLDLSTVLNVTAEDTEFTYNGSNFTGSDYHSIKLEVENRWVPALNYGAVYATVEYSKDNGVTWSEENPTFIDAGEYPVKYRIYVKDSSAADGKSANYVEIKGGNKVTIKKAKLPFDALHGYKGPYDGSTHYVFGHVEYVNGDWGYTYWTSYWWWLDDLTYEFEWTDDNGVAQKTTVTGKDNFLNYREVPGFTKQNVKSLDSDEPGKVVTVKVSGKNYEEKTFTYNVKIGPGRAWAEDTTYTYDGKEHYIANYIAGHLFYWGYYEEYHPGSIKIEYREKGSTEWLPYYKEPGQTDVGFKEVEWKVTMDSDGDGDFGEESNYFGSSEIFTDTNSVTVTKAELTATAGNKTITYGAPAPDYDVSISGFVASENKSVLDDAAPEFECDYVAGKPVGTYTVTPKGLNDNNYKFKYVPGTLTVEQKSVTIELDEDNNPIVKAGELFGDDTCTVKEVEYYLGGTKLNEAPTDPGTYTIKVTKLSNPNYKPKNDVQLIIKSTEEPERPELTVTAKNHKITYGSEPANNGSTIEGLVAPDTEASVGASALTYTYNYTAGNPVGNTYTITPAGLVTEKYDVNYVPGTLTVEPKPVEIELDKDGKPVIKSGELYGTDKCAVETVEYYNGTTKLDAAPTAPGTYTIKVTKLSNGNYTPKNDVEFTIAAPTPVLTVKANNHTIGYGSNPANNGVSITGMVGTDTVEDVSAGLNYAYSYSKGDDVGTYEIEPKGLTTTKYDVVYQKGTLTVTQKPVGIRLAEGSMVPSVFPADVLPGDNCTIIGYEYYQGTTKLDAAPTAPGTYTIKVTKLSNDNYTPKNDVEFTIAAPTPDEQAPTGNINVSIYNWNAFQNDVTFAIYFNEAQTVTITAADDKGVKSVEYFVSPTARPLSEIQSKTEGWGTYADGAVTLSPNNKWVVYARITDTSDNVTYISSNGMIFDSTAPVVDGIEDGKKYSKDVEFTVTDNFKLDEVLVDGEKIEANDDGTYTIKNDGKKHTIVAIDEAGNKTELTITMRKTAAKDDDSPATGDEFNFVLWGFAMVASAAALLFVTMKKKSSNSKRSSRR